MYKKALSLTIIGALILSLAIFHQTRSNTEEPEDSNITNLPPLNEMTNASWERPDGPARIGLQAGHWKNSELPDEFENLRRTGGGTRGGGKAEWEVNLEIATLVAEILKKEGVIVDILPATIPPAYWADVLLSIHADGSESSEASGYKVAAPRRDITGTAEHLVTFLKTAYGDATLLPQDPNITRNMRGYYAFNWRKYEHVMHPHTTGAIIETGFLTNPTDQQLLIKHPEQAAAGIAEGLLAYLKDQKLLDS